MHLVLGDISVMYDSCIEIVRCGNKAIFSRSAESFPISFVTSSNFAGPVKVRSTDDIEVLGLEEGIFGVFSQNGMIWCEGS